MSPKSVVDVDAHISRTLVKEAVTLGDAKVKGLQKKNDSKAFAPIFASS